MKGILFKETLFNAVIKGEKTQTRRLVKKPKDFKTFLQQKDFDSQTFYFAFLVHNTWETYKTKPRYKKDEIIYLKEPYLVCDSEYSAEDYIYKYDWHSNPLDKYKNKLFMPEKAARFFIKITNVRLELLKDITTEDIKAEGIHLLDENATDKDYLRAWETVWDRINGKIAPFDSNPYVWVYEFELH